MDPPAYSKVPPVDSEMAHEYVNLARDDNSVVPVSESIFDKLYRLTTCGLSTKMLAIAHLAFMLMSCPVALIILMLQSHDSYAEPVILFLCVFPLPFLLLGSIAVWREHRILAKIFSGYMTFLAGVTVMFWTRVMFSILGDYSLEWHVRLLLPLLGLASMGYTVHAFVVFWKFQDSVGTRMLPVVQTA